MPSIPDQTDIDHDPDVLAAAPQTGRMILTPDSAPVQYDDLDGLYDPDREWSDAQIEWLMSMYGINPDELIPDDDDPVDQEATDG